MTPADRSTRAFTLLEVMVSVAILALALTAIFSSEAQAIRVARRAQEYNIATLLARCKMNEIEENLTREGLPAVSDSGSDACCEGAEVEGFECEWNVDRIVLPDDTGAYSDDEEGGDALGSLVGDEGAQTSALDGLLSGDASGGGLGGGGGFTEMALGLAFPVLKPSIEEQVRRVTVNVVWGEGDAQKKFDVTQFVVADQGAREEDI